MIVAFAGGVGGAKLAHGLYSALPAHELTVVVNTADDFRLHGLAISPDIDTVLYTLAGIANPATGWGILDDTFNALQMVATLGGADWFRLGDRDIGTHITRTTQLAEGRRLTEVTTAFARALGIAAQVLPMCDQRVATIIETADGPLAFQEYFVKRGCRDTVTGIHFEGLDAASPAPELERALESADALIFCPSNPFVSIGPILGIPGMRERIRDRAVPLAVVSPIVAGQALKGPAARMLEDLGYDSSVVSVAKLYADLAPILFIDEPDAHLADQVRAAGAEPVVAPIVMHEIGDRDKLGRLILDTLTHDRHGSGGQPGRRAGSAERDAEDAFGRRS